MRALLLVQDPDESAVLSLALQRAGLTMSRSVNFDDALEAWSAQPADLIVLATDGPAPLERVRRLRSETEVPLVVVVDPVPEATQVALIDAGSDLLVVRPVSVRLLIAQIRVLARRAAGVPLFTLPTMSVADFTLDPATRSFQIGDGPPRRLTHLEFRLLYTLMIHREHVVPTEALVEHVWGYAGEGDRELVRGLVSRLRAKVEPDPRRPAYIVTVPGVGYSFMHQLTVKNQEP